MEEGITCPLLYVPGTVRVLYQRNLESSKRVAVFCDASESSTFDC